MNDLRTIGLSKRYARAERDAVQRVSLTVEHAEVLTVLGESGCGKTTLLRLIAGLETPSDGRIEIGGRIVVDGRRTVPPERRGVGMVFQDNALFPHLRVVDNIRFGLHGLRGAEQRVRAQAMLTLVGLDGLAERYPHELSGGQQQRVALARALAPQPTVLLLDEPFSNLDVVLKGQMRDEVIDIIRRTGTTAVFVLHDADDALSVSDRVAVLRGGVVQQVAPPDVIYHEPSNEYVARFFGRVNVLPGEPCADGFRTPVGHVDFEHRLNGTRDPVRLSIRPESIELVDDATDGIAAVVRRVRFCGDHRELVVEVPTPGGPAQIVIVHCAPDVRAGTGETVAIRARAGAVRLLDEAPGLRPEG